MTEHTDVGSSRRTWHAWDELYRRQPRVWRGPGGEVPFEGVPGIVLELGCGSGKTLRSLRGADMTVALDVSRAALRACRRAVVPENAHFLQGDVTKLPFADGCADIVIAHHVLGHLLADERTKAAAEIGRVLGPNRLLSVRAMSRDDMRFGGGEAVEPGTFVRGGIFCHFFEEEEVIALFPSLNVIKIVTLSVPHRYEGVERKRSEIVALFRSPA